MKIVLIGAGNLATHLATQLKRKHWNIVQIYSRTEKSASELASSLQIDYTTNIKNIVSDADMYIFSVSDDAILPIANTLSIRNTNAVIVHTSGSVSMDIFTEKFPHYGVIYPLQTFSKTREVDFSIIPLFLEGNDETAKTAVETIANKLSNTRYYVNSEVRQRLHIAAVFACNFTNYMYTIANEITDSTNLSFDVMLPLIDETAAKIHKLQPHKAQTGPAKRYDTKTIKKHTKILENSKDLLQTYNLLTEKIWHLHNPKE